MLFVKCVTESVGSVVVIGPLSSGRRPFWSHSYVLNPFSKHLWWKAGSKIKRSSLAPTCRVTPAGLSNSGTAAPPTSPKSLMIGVEKKIKQLEAQEPGVSPFQRLT